MQSREVFPDVTSDSFCVRRMLQGIVPAHVVKCYGLEHGIIVQETILQP